MKAAQTDWSGWPSPPMGRLSSKHDRNGIIWFPSYGKNSLPHAHMEFLFHLQNSTHTRTALRGKLLGQTGLAGLYLCRSASHLHLKHWGYLLSLLWRRTQENGAILLSAMGTWLFSEGKPDTPGCQRQLGDGPS